MKYGVIVLGMARSGTSLVTELIHRWGAYAGEPRDLKPADERNPRGYWEYRPLRQFNRALLASVGASEELPPADDRCLGQRAKEPRYRAEALALLADMRAHAAVWVWKDPALPLVLAFWKHIWGNVRYIIPIRNPIDIARSQVAWIGEDVPYIPPCSAMLLYWQLLMRSILRHTERAQHKLFVSYEALVAQPRRGCGRLYRFLGQGGKVYPDGQRTIAAMEQAVDPALRHHRAAQPFVHARDATAEQKALYRFLKEKVDNPAAHYRQADFPLYAGWCDYLQSVYRVFELSNQIAPKELL